jgi:asparagine synthetase B (glutamine-hydrolysing)
MPQKVRVLISDPAHRCIELQNGIWIASGLHERAENLLRVHPTESQAEAICRNIGDALLVRFLAQEERLVRIDVWRGITSGYEMFHATCPDGSILLADQFRNILTEIPVSDRAPSESALLDHFLFRAVPAPQTYSSAVSRLGHGDRLTIDIATGATNIVRFDGIDYAWKHGRTADYLDRMDEALEQAFAWAPETKDLVSMFSGGVDSTLLQSCIRGEARALFYAPQSVNPGTPDPVHYAHHAARLLNLKLEIRPLRDEDTWSNLESNIDMAAWPQRVIQTSMYADAFGHRAPAFLQGGRGDALFGAAGTRSALLAARCDGWADVVLPAIGKLPVGTLSVRARKLLQTSRELRNDPLSPHGWAAGMSSRGFTDEDIIVDAVGSSAVVDRLSRRLLYAASRLGPAGKAARAHYQHIELAHWIDYWCEDATAFIRQLALAHRKMIHLPFLTTPMVAMAMSVPTEERYAKGFAAKYLLKRALLRRVPRYPVHQKKGITSMRLPPTYQGERRAAIWEEYPVPDFIPERHRDAVRSFGTPVSHSALTLSMLMKRVMRNPKLARIPGTRVIEVTEHLGAVTQQLREAARNWLWLATTFQTGLALA